MKRKVGSSFDTSTILLSGGKAKEQQKHCCSLVSPTWKEKLKLKTKRNRCVIVRPVIKGVKVYLIDCD